MDVRALGPWFHNLHLPDGTETCSDHPLGDFPAWKWRQIAPSVPADLTGKTALDIGCNAGFYAFELAARGAEVLGIDIDPHYLAQARWAAEKLGLEDRVTFRRAPVYALQTLEQRFDVVLFLGVFYHLRHPLLALDIVADKVGDLLVVQTMTMPGEEVRTLSEDPGLFGRQALLDPGWPKMAFIEHRLADDPTNWWAPNHACVEALLRTAGIEVRDRPGHEIYVCGRAPDRDPETAEIVRDELRAVREVW
jgi:tRNA (mo5U34)-methyltransferase